MSKVLVVDDDFMNLRMAEMILTKYGYEVIKAESGLQCLEYLKQELVDLILLDVHMPQMDGFEVLKQLKENERLAEIPVIFLTADNDKKVEIRGLKEGASDFITKPFIAEVMLQRVKKEIEFKHLQKCLKEEVEQQTKKAEERRKKLERLTAQIMLTLANTIDATPLNPAKLTRPICDFVVPKGRSVNATAKGLPMNVKKIIINNAGTKTSGKCEGVTSKPNKKKIIICAILVTLSKKLTN